MSLRGEPIVTPAKLPDGRVVTVRISVADDSYIAKKELKTVIVELEWNGEHLAGLTTVLNPDQTSEARALAREIVSGLESGTLEPTAAALEPLADSIPTP